jgi:UDP-glucose 4-epimerase
MGPLEHGDIQSAARFREVLERHRPCALMHFAAYAYVEESMWDPMRYYQNNVAGSAAMLRALIEFGPIQSYFPQVARLMVYPSRFQCLKISRNGP